MEGDQVKVLWDPPKSLSAAEAWALAPVGLGRLCSPRLRGLQGGSLDVPKFSMISWF